MHPASWWSWALVVFVLAAPLFGAESLRLTDDEPLVLPAVGAHQLRVLSSNILELTLVTTKAPEPAPITQWNFVDARGELRLPAPSAFSVLVNEQKMPVRKVGFRRRVVYAPLATRDLRIGNYLYLELARSISDDQRVEVRNPDATLWPSGVSFTATAEARRYSPAIHVNQVGYVPGFPKLAMVGYFLGSFGELEPPPGGSASLVDARTGKVVYQCRLNPRRESGFADMVPPYQKVLEASFSEFNTPGEYRLLVPGLGVSFPFFINEGAAAAFARAYALGLYHQRCGTSNTLPFTRFVHGACHNASAAVPTKQDTNALVFLAKASADCTNNPRHVARPLKDFESSLYPFVRRGPVDVAGGHHDAGDYSKYTINCAGLVHALVFSADALPGVGELDNLGLPESNNGKSDLLEEAKWEGDFLAKLQDDDGGFYFLVYPRQREYENNVLPDQGDPQIVWPKNTAATAAATAALAQLASSPRLQQQFPESARAYLKKAQKGWDFLERALKKHGRDGAYQKLTHYGDEFMHDDELAWAACELYLATGDAALHERFRKSFDPADARTRRWGWWRLYESYGRAIRSYAFAAKTGRAKSEQLDPLLLRRCESELIAAADDQLRWARQSAYGTSFPTETKRFRGGGWYFSLDQAFDLAVASALEHPEKNDPRPKYLEALLSNLNYEAGCNPVNVCYVTGLGWKRQREIVHQYAMNDRRVLPPSGIPIGNVQAGFMWLGLYQKELGALSFPADGAKQAPYPLYDRWGDSFNVQTEFVVLNQARALGAAAFLMAQTPARIAPGKPPEGFIEIAGPESSTAGWRATLKVREGPAEEARTVWEAQEHQPAFGATFTIKSGTGRIWLEAEAQWPDGRRCVAVTNLNLSSGRER
jgi:hypothetical protein